LQPLDCGRIDALSLPRAKQAGVPPHGPEGGIDHWTGSHQYWVDTLYMACPVLARSGRLENKPAYVDDAAQQFIVHARHLQDDKTGLFYHM